MHVRVQLCGSIVIGVSHSPIIISYIKDPFPYSFQSVGSKGWRGSNLTCSAYKKPPKLGREHIASPQNTQAITHRSLSSYPCSKQASSGLRARICYSYTTQFCISCQPLLLQRLTGTVWCSSQNISQLDGGVHRMQANIILQPHRPTADRGALCGARRTTPFYCQLSMRRKGVVPALFTGTCCGLRG